MLFFVEEFVKVCTEELKKIKELRMRVCNICEVEKDITEYNLTKEGKYKYKCCKSCYSIKRKAGSKIYYEENKEILNEKSRKYYQENKEVLYEKYKLYLADNKDKIDEYIKDWREENKEILKEKSLKYREENKDTLRESKKLYYQNLSTDEKEKLKEQKRINYNNNLEENRIKKNNYIKQKMNDPLFKLVFNTRTLIRNSIKRQFTKKSKKTQEILGCSFEEFKIYLEEQFDENMNWDNQGSYWHMDHKKPISLAMNEEEVYELNHYTNFQPLYWEDNLSKGNKYNFI